MKTYKNFVSEGRAFGAAGDIKKGDRILYNPKDGPDAKPHEVLSTPKHMQHDVYNVDLKDLRTGKIHKKVRLTPDNWNPDE